MVYEIMGQIQNAVLGIIGTMGVASYAAQRTPQFQEHRQKQETIRQHKEALKEGGKTIRGTRAQNFETALTGYFSELTEDEIKKVHKSGEYYDLLTTQREDFVKNWYDMGIEAKKQAASVIAAKAIIKQNVNAIRDKIKGGV
mgnify:CR=1 FL=1